MIINNIFSNNLTEAKRYYDLIKSLLIVNSEGVSVLPNYFYIPKHLLDLERLKPNTQERLPSPEVTANSSHLWTQSIWIICQLLGNTINRCLFHLI
jgi:hypothetical protein